MKKLKFPTAQTILILIAVFVTLLTWIVPAGKYDSLAYNATTNTFTKTSVEERVVIRGHASYTEPYRPLKCKS